MNNPRSIQLTFCFYLFMACLSENGYSHTSVGSTKFHQFEDKYLAAQARKKDALTKKKRLQHSPILKQKSIRLLAAQPSAALVSNFSVSGKWSAVKTWPFAFASAANLPDGRILAWGGNALTTYTGGTYTYAGIWDPNTDQITSANHTSHSLFCGIPVMLEDGRVFVAGGDNSNASSVKGTSTFNYLTQKWTRIQDMAVGRWYNGAVALPNGQVFTAIGEPGSAYPEIWTSGIGWSYLNGASLQTGILDYPTVTEPKNWLPHFHVAPNGKIFHSGHTPQMHYIDPTGNGSVTPVGLVNDWNTANSPGVLFTEGKLLQAGGALYSNNVSTTKAAVIDLNSSVPLRNIVNSMQFPRIFHNQVVLPNGEIMVIGGNSSGEKFSDVGSQYTPEIWNPLSQTWRAVADLQVPRNYHSVALLMADGRVWSGGGGLCSCSADHPDSQVYSPSYLFNSDGSLATRPEINDVPKLVSYGRIINVLASSGIQKFSMIKMSSTTHTLNSDMRFLDVPFIALGNGGYQLSLHTNRNVMTPGYWMLFALNEQGTPSLAKVIQVSTSDAPVIDNPGDQNTLLGTQVTLGIQARDPNGDGLVFNAVGLPQGLSINSGTGQISGKASAAGSSRVVVSASDGVNTVTVSFIWEVASQQLPPVASAQFGGAGGTAFSDSVTANQQLTGLNIRVGWWVDSIQGITNSGALTAHGGNGGALNNVTWPANEYLVGIYGLYGTYVGQISFVTNTGRVLGPYGTGQGGMNVSNFSYTVPSGYEIVGFAGRASSYLNAVGVMYRARPIINQPPVIDNIAEQANLIGSTVSVKINANDPDNDALTYSATGLPVGLSIAGDTGLITGVPSAVGIYDVVINVQDARGASSGLNFKWNIVAQPLTINPITTSPQQIDVPVNLTVTVTGATNPRYKWSFGDNTPETEYSNTASITHAYSKPGLYVLRLTATDDRGVINTTSIIQAIYAPKTTKQPTSSANLAVSSSNGGQLWVVNQDNDTVSVFNTVNYAKLAEIGVGKSPRTLAIAPDGRVWVSNKASASISVINPVTLQVQQSIYLPYASQPFGLAFAPNGSAAYVALEATGQLLKLDVNTGAQIASVDVGPNPRHLSVSGDSSKVLISRFITRALPGEATATVQTSENNVQRGAEVLAVNADNMAVLNTIVLRHSDKEDTETQGAGIPNYLGVPVISPDGQSAWVPSKQDNIKRGMLRNGKNLSFQNSVRAIGSKINLATLTEDYPSRIDFDNAGLASTAVFDISGSYLFAALETTREVVIIDAYGGRELNRIAVGRAPQGLAVSADGKTLYVNNFTDRSVTVVDLTDLLNHGDWKPPVIKQLASVAAEKLSASALAGKQLFYDAKDPRLAKDGYLSCAACHSEGGLDGRVWDLTGFGEGLRNTIDLRGRAATAQGLLHWSANFDEIQDFEGQIRNLAGGSGLMSDADFNATQNTLGTPKAGKSADLDALAAYVASLNSFASSPYRKGDGSLTDLAIAAKPLFINNCVQCHGGSSFTDSPAGVLHDVGTIKPSSGKRLNGDLNGLDTPTLRDVWNTAPYLHDGSAATLNDAIRAHTNINISDSDIAQVATYVQQIAGSELAPNNTPPSITMTGPTNGSQYILGDSINLMANASDTDGSVVKVEFYAGNQLLGSDNDAPYAITWTNAAAGSFALTAKAYDNYGAVSISSAINVQVQMNNGTGLAAEYFNNPSLTGVPVLQRIEAVNFDWSTASPGTGVAVDNFSVRWIGHVVVPSTGAYQFQTVSDDGVRLTVNGVQLINNWTDHPSTTDTSNTINLVAGTKYQVVMEFYERSGAAIAKLLWKTPGQTSYTAIPKANLFAVTNLAQNKVSSQSSVGYGGLASRAVDGNTNGNWGANSVTHTNADANAWWQVDLGSKKNLAAIQLWNRTDCCAERLSNFYVFVADVDMTGKSFNTLLNDSSISRSQYTGQAPAKLFIPANSSGRYIRVQLAGTNYLSLAEVQVYGQ